MPPCLLPVPRDYLLCPTERKTPAPHLTLSGSTSPLTSLTPAWWRITTIRPVFPVSRHRTPADQSPKSEPPEKRVVCSGPIRAYYRLRLKTLAFTLFKPSALAALTTP